MKTIYVTNKPVILTPYYYDGALFARSRLGRSARDCDIITEPHKLQGRNLAEVPVYLLEGRWVDVLKRGEMMEAAMVCGAKIQKRSL